MRIFEPTVAVQDELRSLTDIHVSCSVRVTGNAVDALAKERATFPGALMCMSSVGRSRLASVLGSFAEGVLYDMFGPVLLVGPHARIDQFNPEDPVIVCTDGSRTADEVLPLAEQWAIALPLEPWIVSVSDPDGVRIPADRSTGRARSTSSRGSTRSTAALKAADTALK